MNKRGFSQVMVDASETSSNATPRERTRHDERFSRTRLIFGLGQVQCLDCGAWFRSDQAHDAHSWTEHGTVSCLTVEMMAENGMMQDDNGTCAAEPESHTWDFE